MSSFYDDASLVVIPSGYKTSKVYAEKPTDGTGDLTFSRSNDTATRVASNGLIEKVRTNLVLQSQTFENAAWTNDPTSGSITVTANYGTAPDGTQTADRIQITRGASYSQLYQTVSVASGSTYTISVYLKSLSGTPNITTIYTTSPIGTQTLTSEWARYTFSFSAPASAVYPMIGLFGANSATCDILAWGFQIETGDIATSYIATTSAAVSVGPVANVPRLDYLNSSCPRLLLEPQRTNLNPYSEQFNNADWEKTNSTITANATTSPDGYTNADAWFETTTNDWHRLYDNGISVTSGTAYTCSLFVKPNGRDWVSMEFFAAGGAFNGSRVWFNIANGTIGTTQTGITAKIENYGNGWYRISATQTAAATTTGYILYLLATGDGVVTYAGDVTKGAFIYGGMTEAGAYATSYIGPTLGASVTRGADACSKTGISSLIGQTEGTFFADFVWTKVNKTYQSILLGATSNYNNTVYFLTTESSGAASYQLRIGGATAIATISTTFTTGTRYKIALAYKSGSIAFYVNGVSVGTSSATYGAVSEAISQFRYGWPYGGDELWCSPVNQTLLFTTRLTNAQLAELTTI